MFDLHGYIISEGWTKKTAQEILDLLSESTPTVVDSKRFHWSDLVKQFGSDDTEILKKALEEKGVTWIADSLAGEGLEVADNEIQQVLSKLDAAGVSGAKTLAELAVNNRSLWEQLTPDPLPSIEEVQSALDGASLSRLRDAAISTGREAMLDRWEAFNAEVLKWSGSGDAPVF